MSTTIDINSDKYKIALKFVNAILVNIGKSEIDELIKFNNIIREDIIKDINKETLNAMESDIFALFDKKKCNYYRKTDAIVLNCLRGMMKELGYKLFKKKKEISEYVNGKSLKRSRMIYSINLQQK